MMLVILSHFPGACERAGIAVKIRFLNLPWALGGMGVVLFWILSGALMIKTHAQVLDLKQFYKKKLMRIYIPHILAYLMLVVLCRALAPEMLWGGKWYSYLLSLMGLDFFGEPLANYGIGTMWLAGEWFTFPIVVIYLIYPILNKSFFQKRKETTILITLLMLLNLKFKIISYGGGWFSITNGIFLFWIGMLVETYRENILNHCTMIFAGGVALALLLELKWPTLVTPGVTELLGVALFLFIYQFDVALPLSGYISKYNFEAYLIHHRFFYIFVPMLITNEHGRFQQSFRLLLLIALVFMVSEKLSSVEKWVLKRIP